MIDDDRVRGGRFGCVESFGSVGLARSESPKDQRRRRSKVDACDWAYNENRNGASSTGETIHMQAVGSRGQGANHGSKTAARIGGLGWTKLVRLTRSNGIGHERESSIATNQRIKEHSIP
jgi:hypothetical protein